MGSSFQQTDFLALVLQRQRQAELRADAIAVRPDMADDANGPAVADGFDDAVNDLWDVASFKGSRRDR